jgi:FKBP-type peptidyl-prolyl cis-trans isomerase
MKARSRWGAALLSIAVAASLPGCHAWGFFRPVDLPPQPQSVSTSGVHWEDLHVGEGSEVVSGSHVSVHYTGRLQDGTKFDSSLDRGVPFEFVVGRGSVIAGWDEGMLGMRAGGTRRIVVPPERAYGSEGRAGVIPPDATLVLVIELLAVD